MVVILTDIHPVLSEVTKSESTKKEADHSRISRIIYSQKI